MRFDFNLNIDTDTAIFAVLFIVTVLALTVGSIFEALAIVGWLFTFAVIFLNSIGWR